MYIFWIRRIFYHDNFFFFLNLNLRIHWQLTYVCEGETGLKITPRFLITDKSEWSRKNPIDSEQRRFAILKITFPISLSNPNWFYLFKPLKKRANSLLRNMQFRSDEYVILILIIELDCVRKINIFHFWACDDDEIKMETQKLLEVIIFIKFNYFSSSFFYPLLCLKYRKNFSIILFSCQNRKRITVEIPQVEGHALWVLCIMVHSDRDW